MKAKLWGGRLNISCLVVRRASCTHKISQHLESDPFEKWHFSNAQIWEFEKISTKISNNFSNDSIRNGFDLRKIWESRIKSQISKSQISTRNGLRVISHGTSFYLTLRFLRSDCHFVASAQRCVFIFLLVPVWGPHRKTPNCPHLSKIAVFFSNLTFAFLWSTFLFSQVRLRPNI